MFKLIKLAIVLGLIMGVVFLGVKIQNKSSEMELNLAEKNSVVQEKIAELKKEVIKKTQALGKVYKEIQEPAVSINPLDDEDKRLTTEILTEVSQNKQPSKEALNISEIYSEASIFNNVVPDKEPAEPLDLNRITEIRNIYSKALETLNLR